MRIDLHDGFYLGPVEDGDQAAYLEHLNDRDVTDWMLVIPYPYTEKDADFWVRHCLDMASTHPHISEFAIRRADGFLVGGMGVRLKTGLGHHRGELGYWLGRSFWGRGLATAGVRAVSAYAFETLNLKRIEATAFPDNKASHRVLDKAGFVREGVLKGYHLKNGILIDACMYALVKNDDCV